MDGQGDGGTLSFLLRLTQPSRITLISTRTVRLRYLHRAYTHLLARSPRPVSFRRFLWPRCPPHIGWVANKKEGKSHVCRRLLLYFATSRHLSPPPPLIAPTSTRTSDPDSSLLLTGAYSPPISLRFPRGIRSSSHSTSPPPLHLSPPPPLITTISTHAIIAVAPRARYSRLHYCSRHTSSSSPSSSSSSSSPSSSFSSSSTSHLHLLPALPGATKRQRSTASPAFLNPAGDAGRAAQPARAALVPPQWVLPTKRQREEVDVECWALPNASNCFQTLPTPAAGSSSRACARPVLLKRAACSRSAVHAVVSLAPDHDTLPEIRSSNSLEK